MAHAGKVENSFDCDIFVFEDELSAFAPKPAVSVRSKSTPDDPTRLNAVFATLRS